MHNPESRNSNLVARRLIGNLTVQREKRKEKREGPNDLRGLGTLGEEPATFEVIEVIADFKHL